jgi:hypothetical protein
MANIKDPGRSAAKFVQRASVAGPDYQAGIQNPRRAWAEAASAAEQNYTQGVTAAAQAGRFGAGVRKAGNAKWQENSLAKGPARYAEGAALAQGAYESGFKPYGDAIRALNLPARGPRGSPANLQRVSAVANALRDVKVKSGK